MEHLWVSATKITLQRVVNFAALVLTTFFSTMSKEVDDTFLQYLVTLGVKFH